jgi:tetratricopeptide (TPR) repeat protein
VCLPRDRPRSGSPRTRGLDICYTSASRAGPGKNRSRSGSCRCPALRGRLRQGTSIRQHALALARNAADRPAEAVALINLGVVQQLTGDHPAAAADLQRALALARELGSLPGQAEALNRLGELATRTSDTSQARTCHTKALAIARDLGAAPEQARALEGLGEIHLQEGNPGHAAAHLQQAMAIYKRIGVPAARRIQHTARTYKLTSTTPELEPPASTSAGHQRRSGRGDPHSQEDNTTA